MAGAVRDPDRGVTACKFAALLLMPSRLDSGLLEGPVTRDVQAHQRLLSAPSWASGRHM